MNMQKKILTLLLAGLLITSCVAFASDNTAVNSVGVQGYDPVAYHTGGGPIKGNGHHIAVHQGTTYLFISEDNQKAFEANPSKYLPAFGGYCAYGVSVGKKFVGDPLVWRVVDGKLYLNLDKDIQVTWMQDIPGNIVKANENWPRIKDVHPADL